jgi:hypothetical protein
MKNTFGKFWEVVLKRNFGEQFWGAAFGNRFGE